MDAQVEAAEIPSVGCRRLQDAQDLMKAPLRAWPFPEKRPLDRPVGEIGTGYGREVAGHERLDPGNVLQPQGGVIAFLLSAEVRQMLRHVFGAPGLPGLPAPMERLDGIRIARPRTPGSLRLSWLPRHELKNQRPGNPSSPVGRLAPGRSTRFPSTRYGWG